MGFHFELEPRLWDWAVPLAKARSWAWPPERGGIREMGVLRIASALASRS